MKHSISFYNILLFIIIFINIQCYSKFVQGTATTATNNNNNSYDNIINDVIAIINKGDIISAENKVMNHIDIGNDNDKSDIWHILSSIKYRQQKHTTGYEFAKKAIELASTITTNGNKLIPDYYSTAADHAMQIGKTNECKELLETSLQTWPKHGQSLLLLGKLHQYSISSDLIAKGQSKDAVDKVYLDATKYYERYLELFPEEHGIRNDLALLLMNFPNRRNDGKKTL
jgi:tetratricopeptide (TPR) repeat protein